MAKFTVRVELHDANSEDYDNLHKKMEAKGYSREISSNGKTYQLPSAEYICEKNLKPQQLEMKSKKLPSQ